MKYSLAFVSLIAAASAAPAITNNLANRDSNGPQTGTPFCEGKDHCVHLDKHAFTYLIDPKSDHRTGWRKNKQVVCESYDENGHGRGSCQFPNKVSTTIQCEGTGDIVYAHFGCKKSYFSFIKQTKVQVSWMSTRNAGLPSASNATVLGDDLYVNCHAGRLHHHQDDQPSQQGDKNWNQGLPNTNGQNQGTKQDSTDTYGQAGKGNWNQGLPNTNGQDQGTKQGSTDTYGQAGKGNWNQGLPNTNGQDQGTKQGSTDTYGQAGKGNWNQGLPNTNGQDQGTKQGSTDLYGGKGHDKSDQSLPNSNGQKKCTKKGSTDTNGQGGKSNWNQGLPNTKGQDKGTKQGSTDLYGGKGHDKSNQGLPNTNLQDGGSGSQGAVDTSDHQGSQGSTDTYGQGQQGSTDTYSQGSQGSTDIHGQGQKGSTKKDDNLYKVSH